MRIYDARGNIYAVADPSHLHRLGIDVPTDAKHAAISRGRWAPSAVSRLCSNSPGDATPSGKAHRTDGLLVGPFQSAPPFDLLVVNTDGTLVERSGNGLTIFAQSLIDSGAAAKAAFALRVHHDQSGEETPTITGIEPAVRGQERGFWLDLGLPGFGSRAVGARRDGVEAIRRNGHTMYRVQRLRKINPLWSKSVFVRVGNPHCVTLLDEASLLPTMDALTSKTLSESLAQIAFTSQGDADGQARGLGDPCAAGINLQWAACKGPNRLIARIFERGEGAACSSGTSASAVACAGWKAGLIAEGEVHIEMPGGCAPVRLAQKAGALERVWLFGTAKELKSTPPDQLAGIHK